MPDQCSTHPDRSATGRCVRCAGGTCPLCTVEVGGRVFCSILCFTEQALESKGKTLKLKKDPLANALQKPSSDSPPPPAPIEQEPSVVMGAQDADPQDESSIMAPPASDESSMLDMSSPKGSGVRDESSIEPVEGRMKEPTSILNMGAFSKEADGTWLDEPPKSETPLPILLPGTRRSTIPSACVFHGDTPAVVRCSKCGDPICTLCIADEEHGGRCSPNCRRDRRRRGRTIAIVAAAAAVAALGWAFRPGRETPPQVRPLAESIGKAEAEARAAEAERLRLEAAAREEARRRVEAREKEEARLKAEAEAKAKEEARRAAEARAEAVRKAEADAKEALATAEARAAAEAAEKAAKEKAEREARDKAASEARAKAEAERKAKEEARRATEAKAEAEEKARARAAEKALAVETSLRKASGLIREATPAFCALADQADSDSDDPRALVPRIDSVIGWLSGARSEYAGILGEAATRSTLERRITILDQLVAALREFRARCVDGR